ncbi:MAG TPA: reverse transcriptase domain-containing protein [Pseudonocardiaceae bacterium]|nr:reverse transcriptase domain-containing protein [Pseudonocardiaceae bacterium]
MLPDGRLQARNRGTPQGSAVSPILANLFLHYAFDAWMAREFLAVLFERYADDAVVHCVSERQARYVLAAIRSRMNQVGLQLHPDKTRIVYCKDGNRASSCEHTSFTFLGYTFRARAARDRHGTVFTAFVPAISADALKQLGRRVRRWQLHRRTDLGPVWVFDLDFCLATVTVGTSSGLWVLPAACVWPGRCGAGECRRVIGAAWPGRVSPFRYGATCHWRRSGPALFTGLMAPGLNHGAAGLGVVQVRSRRDRSHTVGWPRAGSSPRRGCRRAVQAADHTS